VLPNWYLNGPCMQPSHKKLKKETARGGARKEGRHERRETNRALLLGVAALFMVALSAPTADAKYQDSHRKHHPHHKPGKPYDHPHWKHHKKPPTPNPDPDPAPPEPEPGPDTEPPVVHVVGPPYGGHSARTRLTLHANEPVTFYCDVTFGRTPPPGFPVYKQCSSGTETVYTVPIERPWQATPVLLFVKGVDAAGNDDETHFFYIYDS
jgi:hypothetical protein